MTSTLAIGRTAKVRSRRFAGSLKARRASDPDWGDRVDRSVISAQIVSLRRSAYDERDTDDVARGEPAGSRNERWPVRAGHRPVAPARRLLGRESRPVRRMSE